MLGIIRWPVGECDVGKGSMKANAEQHGKRSQCIQVMESMRGGFAKLNFFSIHG